MLKIAKDNRNDSLKDLNQIQREKQVLDILKSGIEMTAREIAELMFNKGYTADFERNNASPRLTSLLEKRKVMIVGKKRDKVTHKKVSIYKISPEEENEEN